MKWVRQTAAVTLALIFLASLLADVLAPASYAQQFREFPSSLPSWQFPLGTDDLGRDRLSRLLHGTRVSLLLAPAAALLATMIAAVVGGVAGYRGGWSEKLAARGTDLMLSLPWLFLLLTARAALPLNTPPWVSVVITFLLLGLLGWAGSARVVLAGARSLREADFLLQARATGCGGARLVARHLLPNLQPVLRAQFWVSIPMFILAEANLGILGLGVTEPLPSWGGLLRELQNYLAVQENPWLLAPAVLLLVVVSCMQIVFSGREESI